MKKIHAMVAILLLMATACQKENGTPPESQPDVVVSVSGVTALQILPYVSERTAEVKVQSDKKTTKDISVSLREDAETFDRLNDERINEGLEPYERFPLGSYEFERNGLVIPMGEDQSQARVLKYFPAMFDTGKDYLLAVKVVESSEYNVDEVKGIVLISNATRINSRVYFHTVDPDDLVAPITVFPFADERTLSFSVGLDAETLPQEDVQVDIIQDLNALSMINAERVLDGQEPYLAFPESGFSIDKMQLALTAGQSLSEEAVLTYYPNEFDPSKEYVLPITITSASGYSIDPVSKTLLITVPKYNGVSSEILKAEMANQGWEVTASSYHDNGTLNHHPSKIIDGDFNTFWQSKYGNLPNTQFPGPNGETNYTFPFPHWLRIDMKEAKYIDKIRMHGGYQTAWTEPSFTHFDLRGSIDGTTWFDIKTGIKFTVDQNGKHYVVVPGTGWPNPAPNNVPIPATSEWPVFEVDALIRHLEIKLTTKHPNFANANLGGVQFFEF